jgi:hypothetical protein
LNRKLLYLKGNRDCPFSAAVLPEGGQLTKNEEDMSDDNRTDKAAGSGTAAKI